MLLLDYDATDGAMEWGSIRPVSFFRMEDLIINTLVYQSFRTHEVPVWMETCMQSVRQWADFHGFSYRFIDDTFFDCVPDWFKTAVNGQRHLVADFARLELARQYLDEGWGRVIWVDADVYICDREGFRIGTHRDHWLCHELWVSQRTDGLHFSNRVNNAIVSFSQGNRFLDFYRHACQKIVQTKKSKLRHTEIGTSFLTGISQLLPLLKGVAMFSPLLLADFYNKNESVIAQYRRRLGTPIKAVNLCLTFRNTQYGDLYFSDEVFTQVIEYLDAITVKS